MGSERSDDEPLEPRVAETTSLLRLRANGLEWRQVEGEIVALDVRQDQYLYVNRTGAVLWAALVSGATREQLVGLLEQRFDVDHQRALVDVDDLLSRLEEHDLLETS